MTSDYTLHDRLQYQVAIFARRVEQVRIGGVGAQRNSMDRAAFLVLNRLDWEGPMGVKALADALVIDSSTVTRQVAPLVDAGLVERVQNPDDKRAVFLALSPLGRERLEEVRTSRQELVRRLIADWPQEDRESFCELLARFNLSMESYSGGSGSGSESGSGGGSGGENRSWGGSGTGSGSGSGSRSGGGSESGGGGETGSWGGSGSGSRRGSGSGGGPQDAQATVSSR
ncbi:MarR family winged helix-turn-helix transcriptional regulator [Peterkaempfera bronchialis]|uniref:MarR family transcriptional regulator n=1 Tax=Peterkaempfera bronchialis TaxID=2126346 RepID=A0A345SZQ8_9ACTN|nr:MarR family transcriptional regulator [Peterkaempfera bronchialis]